MRRICAVLLTALLLIPLPAGAVFSETLETLENTGSLRVCFDQPEIDLLNASDEALSLAGQWLEPLALELTEGTQGAFLTIRDGAHTPVHAALDLEDTEPGIPILNAVSRAESLFSETFPTLFDTLSGEEPPLTEEKNTSFQTLGYSPLRRSLTVTGQEFDLLQKGSLYRLDAGQTGIDPKKASEQLHLLKQQFGLLFQDLPMSEDLRVYLNSLSIEGDMVFRRNLDAQEQDMAFQLGGRISRDGAEIRKLTLVIGKNAKALYLSVKAPAVKGGTNFQFILTAPTQRETSRKNTREYTLNVRHTVENEVWTREDSLTAVNEKSKQEELTFTVQREERADGITETRKTVIHLDQMDDSTLEGTITYDHQYAASKVLTVHAHVTVGSGAEETDDQPPLTSPEDAAAALLRFLMDKRSSLTVREQRIFDHLLRTDAWMVGPFVLPLSDDYQISDQMEDE